MKTITITKKDLKNKNYSNAEISVENHENEENINMNNELADFLFSCFKTMNNFKNSTENSNNNTLGFISSMPRTIIKEALCINIVIQKSDIQTMKENIVKYFIKALKQINRSYYTIEEIALNIIEQAEDSLECMVETNCNKIIKVGA